MTTQPHILIADDDRAVRRLVQQTLELQGWRVCAAEDGREALALAAETRFDLAVLDWLMPYYDGLETAAALKARQPWIHTILLTAFSEDHDVAMAYREGIDLHLSKPVNPAELAAFADRLMLPAVVHPHAYVLA